MNLHPHIQNLEAQGNALYAQGDKEDAKRLFLEAGRHQETLFNENQYKDSGYRFLNAQWCWAVGHIGIIDQLIKYNIMLPKHKQFRLVIETQGRCAQEHFLNSFGEHILIYDKLPEVWNEQSLYNQIYFAAPFGESYLIDWCKKVERNWEKTDRQPLACLNANQLDRKNMLLKNLGVNDSFTAIHARFSEHDKKRNVTDLEVYEHLKIKEDCVERNDLVSIGLEPHPINKNIKNLLKISPHERKEASFLLTATCDHFIGSDSGMWTIAHTFGRPVEILNDYERNAWIYE